MLSYEIFEKALMLVDLFDRKSSWFDYYCQMRQAYFLGGHFDERRPRQELPFIECNFLQSEIIFPQRRVAS